MKKMLKNENEKAFTNNGWLRTGDIASVDYDGFYTIVGRYKDIIAAFIITKDGKEIDTSYIREFVKTNLASYKRPKYIAFLSKFPITESGKVQKLKLRESGIQLWNLVNES